LNYQNTETNADAVENEYDINEHYNLNEREKEENQSIFGFEENYIRKASEKINELIMSKVRFPYIYLNIDIIKSIFNF
jgi:hypothetical protein